MARVYPFRAWRYSSSAARLADVLTQPSDRISPAMQQAYYQRSPFNLVRIILGLPQLFDAERGESVYTRAARDFQAWREQGVLVQEKDPCIFAYAQRFNLPGTDIVKERRGFIALGRLHDYADQVVFSHQRADAKHEHDRLDLLTATHAHFEPILMLYSDPAGSVEEIIYDQPGPAEAEVTDEHGVLHRLWRVSDPAVLRLLTTAMDDKKLIIADGRHGYETALEYSKTHATTEPARIESNPHDLPQPPFPEAAAIMTFVNMDADGLVILPAHRVVHSLEDFDPAKFAAAAKEFFTVEAISDRNAGAFIDLLDRRQSAALIAVTQAGALLLQAKPEAAASPQANLPDRQLEACHSYSIVFERLLGLNAEQIGKETNLRTLRDAAEAVAQVRRGEAAIAFLSCPVPLEQLKEAAFAGELLPPQSTDFFPKLLSGLAIYALE